MSLISPGCHLHFCAHLMKGIFDSLVLGRACTSIMAETMSVFSLHAGVALDAEMSALRQTANLLHSVRWQAYEHAELRSLT